MSQSQTEVDERPKRYDPRDAECPCQDATGLRRCICEDD